MSPFTQHVAQQGQEETQLLQETTQNQEWEENGVNWSKSADGSLHYYDNETGQWILYQTE